VDVPLLHRAFEAFAHRPQFFMEALGQALSPLAGRDEEARMESEFSALRPLEQAVLWRLLTHGSRFRPYDGDALRFYGDTTGDTVTAQMAQHALESLRSRSPALVWKSARRECDNPKTAPAGIPRPGRTR
jgi:hypothetical protein